jgi:DNA-binding MarR family transcriptional regulator
MRDDSPRTAAAMRDRLHLEQFIPYRLSVLTNIVSMSIADAYEREFGLSIPQWRVIAVLARYPDLSAIEVAERTAMDKVAVSRAVQGLLASKRLVRGYDRGDRRRSVLRLSAAGRAVYTRVAPLALAYERRLLAALSPSDRRALDRLLARLIDRARALDGRGAAPATRSAARVAARMAARAAARSRSAPGRTASL